MSDDVEQIVAGLSPLQQAALKGSPVKGRTKPDLRRAGLLRLEPLNKAGRERFYYTPTELGLAVRTALLSKKGGSADA